MSANIFNSDRTIDSVAYDIALLLASRDKSLLTPVDVIQKIESLLPECIEVAEKQRSKENPVPVGGIFL